MVSTSTSHQRQEAMVAFWTQEAREATRLPSHCSPRADVHGAHDVDMPTTPLPAPVGQAHHMDDAPRSATQPPASLVSPLATPPSTPDVVSEEARGVPVDSTDPEAGGCGATQPALLATLPHVECIVRARIPTTTGAEMFLHLYTNDVDNKEHLAIVFGPHIRSRSLDTVRPAETEMDRLVRGAYTGRLYPGRTTSGPADDGAQDRPAPATTTTTTTTTPTTTPLVRIHSECYTGETVWSARCDCGEQLDEAARLMSLATNAAGGIIVYLRQEGRGIGLGEKLKAYNLQDLGNDTVQANLLLRHPADARSYGLATAMLRDLGQTHIRLLTNNPDKIRAVEGPKREIVVTERVPMVPLSWKGPAGFRAPEVDGYLKTKIEKMGHMLDMAASPR